MMEIEKAQRMLRDAQRGDGVYTLDDYAWLVNKLYGLLECYTYIISSGGGYFVRFEKGSPVLDTDPMRARRMSGEEATEVIKQFWDRGFVGGLERVIYGRIK